MRSRWAGIGLLLIAVVVVGCGKSKADLRAEYEFELRELERMEAKLREETEPFRRKIAACEIRMEEIAESLAKNELKEIASMPTDEQINAAISTAKQQAEKLPEYQSLVAECRKLGESLTTARKNGETAIEQKRKKIKELENIIQ